MIYKICRKCQKLISSSDTYCDKCLSEVNKFREEMKRKSINKYNSKRNSKYKQFYNSKEWNVLKNKKMQDEQYRCERCGKLAVEVHHIIPIQCDNGWEKRLVYSNLKCVCVKCHNFYHNRFKEKRRQYEKKDSFITTLF